MIFIRRIGRVVGLGDDDWIFLDVQMDDDDDDDDEYG